MKKIFTLTFIFLSIHAAAQTSNNKTQSLLSWLVNKDYIQYLYAKSNAAIFYEKNILTMQTLIADSDKTLEKKCMQDFLSDDEIRAFKTVPRMLKQTDWRIKYAQLKTKFVINYPHKFKKEAYTVYTFSEPIFLNKNHTRVIIGEYFICGPACGRDDLLLCEFKNAEWQLIGRAVIFND